MRKLLFLAFILLMALPAVPAFGSQTEYFKARVVSVDATKQIESDGHVFIQQDLTLEIIDGELTGQKVKSGGLSGVEVVEAAAYSLGDKVWISRSTDADGNELITVTDYVRSGKLLIIALAFAALAVAVGGIKGFRSLISLVLSFIVIIKMIIPNIISGGNPVFWGVFGSFLILLTIIYLTDGISRKSHIAAASISIILGAIYLLSFAFTGWLKLSGLANEEATFLLGFGLQAFDFRGLLLAGFVIGAIGALDDVVISQIEAVSELKAAAKNFSDGQIFSSALKIGRAHLGAMINTLFLTYAGSGLLLLVLFNVAQEPFLSFGQVVDNEMIATEIIRTLIGSIGIILSLPLTTWLAVKFIDNDRN